MLVSVRIHLHFNLKFLKAGLLSTLLVGTGKCFYISRPVHNYTQRGRGWMIDRYQDPGWSGPSGVNTGHFSRFVCSMYHTKTVSRLEFLFFSVSKSPV